MVLKIGFKNCLLTYFFAKIVYFRALKIGGVAQMVRASDS